MEVDRGGEHTAVSTSDPTVGELPQVLNNRRSIDEKGLTIAHSFELQTVQNLAGYATLDW